MTTPALPTTNIEICNAALTKLGDDPISGFDEGTSRADICFRLYESSVAILLAKNRWRFATKYRIQLNEDATFQPPPDDSKWRFRFNLPNDLVYVVRTYSSRDYELYENQLYTSAFEEFIDYCIRANESAWPSYFIKAMVDWLAVEFAIPIGQEDKRAAMERSAWLSWTTAAYLDASSRPSDPIQDQPFINVRYMGVNSGFGSSF